MTDAEMKRMIDIYNYIFFEAEENKNTGDEFYDSVLCCNKDIIAIKMTPSDYYFFEPLLFCTARTSLTVGDVEWSEGLLTTTPTISTAYDRETGEAEEMCLIFGDKTHKMHIACAIEPVIDHFKCMLQLGREESGLRDIDYKKLFSRQLLEIRKSRKRDEKMRKRRQ